MINFSSDQKKVMAELLAWLKHHKTNFITVGGYAGTGKTTLIAVLRKKLYYRNKKLKVAFVSFTGKAARVLKTKLIIAKAVAAVDFVGTIHSLIYSPIINNNKEIIGWEKRKEIKYDLIVIDEASMVDEEIWNDLSSYQIPIIAVGDHGQLPPIRGNFNLMEKPNLKLEKIHRQAKNNPIIQLSRTARRCGKIPALGFGPKVWKMKREDYQAQEKVEELLANYNEDTLVICGYNDTRIKLNNFIRRKLGFDFPTPQVGDRVICLRNNREKGIYNGMLGRLLFIKKKDKGWYQAEIKMDDEKELYDGLIAVEQFNRPRPMNFSKERKRIIKGDLFDFGYALTVHKAQGSQAKRVILFEERFSRMNDEQWRRWLYTAVTRAEEELYIIGE